MNSLEAAQKLLSRIKRLGMSKYRLAKIMGVRWGSIHAWEKGWWSPNAEHLNKLQMVFIEECGKHGKTAFDFEDDVQTVPIGIAQHG